MNVLSTRGALLSCEKPAPASVRGFSICASSCKMYVMYLYDGSALKCIGGLNHFCFRSKRCEWLMSSWFAYEFLRPGGDAPSFAVA